MLSRSLKPSTPSQTRANDLTGAPQRLPLAPTPVGCAGPTNSRSQIMSYNPTVLFDELSARLCGNPRKTLRELSMDLHISDRTIEKTIRLFAGTTFRQFREKLLLMTIMDQFADRPEITIKEVLLGLGFK